MKRLHQKVAVVTGEAGIGAAIARRFVAEGAWVLIGDRDGPRAAALCTELGDAAGFQEVDVADAGRFQRRSSRW